MKSEKKKNNYPRPSTSSTDVARSETVERLKPIAAMLREYISGIASIIVVGSIGRGEADVKACDGGASVDIDLYLVMEESINLHNLASEVEDLVGNLKAPLISGINTPITLDLHFLNIKCLSSLDPRIRFYDLKYGSTVLDGIDVRDQIPAFKPEDIPLYEGFRLLHNRFYYIGEQLNIEKLKQEHLDQDTQTFLWKSSSKNYMIACQALSVLAGAYDPLVKHCASELMNHYDSWFPELARQRPDLAVAVNEHVGFIISNNIPKGDPLEKFFESLRCLFDVIKYYQGRFAGTENLDDIYEGTCKVHLMPYVARSFRKRLSIEPPNFIVGIGSFAAQIFLRFKWMRKLKLKKGKYYAGLMGDYRDPAIKIYAVLLYLFLSVDSNITVDMQALNKAADYLISIYPIHIGNYRAPEEQFNFVLQSAIDAYDICFAKGPTISNNFMHVILRVID